MNESQEQRTTGTPHKIRNPPEPSQIFQIECVQDDDQLIPPILQKGQQIREIRRTPP